MIEANKMKVNNFFISKYEKWNMIIKTNIVHCRTWNVNIKAKSAIFYLYKNWSQRFGLPRRNRLPERK